MRPLDLLVGMLWTSAMTPFLVLLTTFGLRFDVVSIRVVGRGPTLFRRRRLVFRPGPLRPLALRLRLDRFFDGLDLLRGRLALVGPRPMPTFAPHAFASYRVAMRPGLVSPFALRQAAQIAYDGEAAVDFEYATTRSVPGDLGLLARSLFARVHGAVVPPSARERIDIDGLRIDNLTMSQSVRRILGFLEGGSPRSVSFVNADCVNLAARIPDYRRALRFSDLVLGDGVGVRLFSRLIGTPLRENVNGTDLFPRLCAALEGSAHSIYLLGGRPGVADSVAGWIVARYPGVRIAGSRHGYFPAGEDSGVAADIARTGASVLLVAFGAPRQELWIKDHLAATGARAGIGVGGLFDFYSGRIPRAPMWMREAGLEWLYRFSREPKRLWRRYGPGNVEFVWRASRAAARRRRAAFIERSAH